jgi:hypothetical protein
MSRPQEKDLEEFHSDEKAIDHWRSTGIIVVEVLGS